MNTQPRRKWHLQRWLLLLAAGLLAYAGWTQYDFRAALKEAKALGWEVEYTDPVIEIRGNWKNAFKKETWLDGVTFVVLSDGEAFEQHLAIVHRLNPRSLTIDNPVTLRDLSGLKPITRLQGLGLTGCSGLMNVDGLKNLSALQTIYLSYCMKLTNVDALKNLSAMQKLVLTECTELTNVDGLKNLSALQRLALTGCTRLTNVDGLKNLSALKEIALTNCTGLKNVDALKNLKALEAVELTGCTGLTKESIEALKAALPNTTIHTD